MLLELRVFMSYLDDTKFLNLSHLYNRTKMVNLYLECGMGNGIPHG